MIYAVIDTNVLVSASITKNPLSSTVKVVANMLDGHIRPVYNRDIISFNVGYKGLGQMVQRLFAEI